MADENADIHVDTKELSKLLRKALDQCPEYLFQELKEAGFTFLDEWIGKSIKEKRFSRNGGGDTLRTRSANLVRAFKAEVGGTDIYSLSMRAGTLHQGLPYAWVQEFGGNITPKRAKWLTVPLEPALTPAGVLRKPAREWPDTFVKFAPGGMRGLILQKRDDGPPVALFALVKRVMIAGRLGFFDSWQRNEPVFIRYLGEAVQKALDRMAKRQVREGG